MNAEKKLRLENNKLDKQLTKENNEIVTDLVIYIQDKNLSDYNMQVVRREITAMALESQMRDIPLGEVFGEDYKGFCDELVKNSPQKSRYEQILFWVNLIAIVSLVALLIIFLSDLGEQNFQDIGALFSNFTVNGLTIVRGVILLAGALLIYKLIIGMAFEKGKEFKKAILPILALTILFYFGEDIISLPFFAPLNFFSVSANFLVFFLPVLGVLIISNFLYNNLMNKLAAQ